MGHSSAFDVFLNNHRDQLTTSNVPQHLWHTLWQKLLNQTFDAGNTFRLLKLEYEQERQEHEPIWTLQALSNIDRLDPKQIFLIDHAWTYRVNNARQLLLEHDLLRNRLCNLFDLSSAILKDELVEKIFDNTWKINNTYSIVSAENVEDRLPIWYIMDEIGSAVLHNDNPNCRLIPFVYINDQVTYSILFPIKDIDEEDLIYRDFAEGINDPERRSAILIPWVPKSFQHVDITLLFPGPDYFLSGHVKESLPILSNFLEGKSRENNRSTLKVFTQYSLIRKYLTNNKYTLIENKEDADILWYVDHFKDFELLSKTPEKFVNQFPFEYVLTVKDLLCITCRRTKSSEKWLPVTYNLSTEIMHFVSYFQHRQNEGLDNFWIIKPYNLARGLDIHITDNLNYIMKIAVTGHKIVQKYIINPVLFYRPECGGKVKFDIRYVILLKSTKPLSAYVHKEFFLRFANTPFKLNEFYNYEKHFTVMNYTENADLKHMKCEEFKIKWSQQYSSIPWPAVQELILQMLRDILECAIMEAPPCGIAESPQSRAVYAADLMLEWTENKGIQPKILEVNFTPDCKRACDYYPDFYNDIFNLLFLDKKSDVFLSL